jgi:phage terminase small subunit
MTCRNRGFMLSQMPAVQKRMAELREKRFAKLEITAERTLQELAKIAYADAGLYYEWGPDGVTVRDSSELGADPMGRDSTSAVAEVLQTITEHGGTIKVKLHDKHAALVTLAKHQGLLTEKVDVTSGGKPFESLTDEERAARVVALLDKARARRD